MTNIEKKNSKKNEKPKKGISSMAKFYLILYNFVQTIGWSYILYQLINFYINPTNKTLYDTVKCSLMIFQNAAILEVLHCIVKIVPSNPLITAMQVASRVVVVCGVLMITTAARESIGLPLCLLAWSLTEVIRYGNYTLNLLNAVPYFLVWLRYSFFIILYPIGITGELLCTYAAQKEIEKTQLLTISMPNSLNFLFNYQYFLWVFMLLYIPLFPKLYFHMFSQRIKVLGRSSKKTD